MVSNNHAIYVIVSEDLSKVMVKIGREYFVELTQEETLRYIEKKEKVMSKRTEMLSEQAA